MLEVQELKRIDERAKKVIFVYCWWDPWPCDWSKMIIFPNELFFPTYPFNPWHPFLLPVTFHTAFWWTLLSSAKTFQWLSPLVIEMLTLQTWLLQSIFPHLGHLPSLRECFPIHLPVHGPASLKGVSQTPPDTQDLHCMYTTPLFKDSLDINEKWKGVIGRELMKANTVARVLYKWKKSLFCLQLIEKHFIEIRSLPKNLGVGKARG